MAREEKQKDTRSAYWCFTINNPEEKDCKQLLKLYEDGHATYVVVGREQGEEKKTKHLQGYVEFRIRQRLSSVKRMCTALGRAHLETRRGTSEQASAYCKKDGDYDEDSNLSESKQGKRNDLNVLRDFVASGETDMLTIMNNCDAAFRYQGAVISYVNLVKRQRLEKMDLTLKPWQESLMKTLEEKADPRQVLWYWETTGGTGKTTMARYLVRNHGAFYSNGGKTNDIAYAYDEESIVIFDFTRSQEEHINYGVIEALKNGMITSNKYQSTTKIFEIPHVVIFANFEPNYDKLSQDRWNVTEIK